MGWWKIDGPEGHIDTDHKGPGGLCNAVPLNYGTESPSHPELHYNGDGPADIIATFARSVCEFYTEAQLPCPSVEAIFAFIRSGEPIPDTPKSLLGPLAEGRTGMWRELDNEYIEAWERPPYDEERAAAVNFVSGGFEP